MKTKFKSLHQYFKEPGSPLKRLSEKANRLEYMNQIVLRALDPETAEHCIAISYENGVLTIAFESAAWATRCRYTFSELKKRLPQYEESFKHLDDIKCVIRPQLFTKEKTPSSTKPVLSHDNANYIRETASEMQDGKLKNALERLARNES